MTEAEAWKLELLKTLQLPNPESFGDAFRQAARESLVKNQRERRSDIVSIAPIQLALAALDVESKVNAVDLQSGMEELKRRLEVLLGARPEAPVDESEKARQEAVALQKTHRERIAVAGGQLLSSAFAFLGELIPGQPETEESRRMSELFQQQLNQCLEKDDRGQFKLTVTLPDPAAVANLASSLARLVASAPRG